MIVVDLMTVGWRTLLTKALKGVYLGMSSSEIVDSVREGRVRDYE